MFGGSDVTKLELAHATCGVRQQIGISTVSKSKAKTLCWMCMTRTSIPEPVDLCADTRSIPLTWQSAQAGSIPSTVAYEHTSLHRRHRSRHQDQRLPHAQCAENVTVRIVLSTLPSRLPLPMASPVELSIANMARLDVVEFFKENCHSAVLKTTMLATSQTFWIAESQHHRNITRIDQK